MTPVVVGFVRASAPTSPRAGSPATTYSASATTSAAPTTSSRPRSFKKVEYQSRAPSSLPGGGTLDSSLTEEQQLLKKTVRDFAEAEIAPHAREWDDKQEFPREVFTKLG